MPSIKIYSKEQVDDLISRVTPPTVVQTTGTSTTSVMSQDAVTTALGNKADTSALPTSSQLVPSTSGASSGDVLSFDGTNIGWNTGGSSGMSVHTYTSMTDIYNDIVAHFGECLVLVRLPKATTVGSNKPWIVINKIYLETNLVNMSSIVGITDGTVCYHLVEIGIQNNGNFARERVQGTGTYSGSTITYLILSSNNGYNLNLTYEDFKLIY